MSELRRLLKNAAVRGADYLEGLDVRSVAPDPAALDALASAFGDLPPDGTTAESVLEELDRLGSPATMGSAGGRYFGFVIGGSVPGALAANLLAGAWDQCAGMRIGSPGAAIIEDIACRWLLQLLRLPANAGVGLTTGATMANFVGLAAARHALLSRQGWSVERHGLYGAPEIEVIVGEQVHVSALKALGMLGLGSERVTRVPVDDQGRMLAEQCPPLNDRCLVLMQAGNVNTGAFDPAIAICEAAAQVGAWVHVDGAFGLWARATRQMDDLTHGLEQADSLAADAHKWLNVPYDCGVAVVRDAEALASAMAFHAPYLVHGENREPAQYTPEMSRRARGVEVFAALRQLGAKGVAELIERNCRQARHFAEGLRMREFEILNDVVLNQVLVAFGSDDETRSMVEALQRDGTFWAGGTTWKDRQAMRISVSSWRTTDEDIQRCLDAVDRVLTKNGCP